MISNHPLDLERQIRSGEERILHLGETTTGRVLVVVVTALGENMRVVTAYPADKRERKYCFSLKGGDAVEKILQTPEFKSEEEEADWWVKNRDLVLNEFKQAAADGTLGRGTLMKRGLTPTTTIRLDPNDIELARSQAEQRGLKYQTYLKMIIHQALTQEAGKLACDSTGRNPKEY